MRNIYLFLLALACTSVGFGLPFTGTYNFDSSVNETVAEVFLTYKRTYVEPTTSATNYSTSGIATTNATLNWVRGNGDNVLVVVRQGGAVDTDPTSGTPYTANSSFGNGEEIGTGNYVVYNGPGTNVNVSGLLQNTVYSVAIYEYDDVGTSYNTTELTGNFTTACDTVLSLPFNEGFEGGAIPPTCWRSFSGVNGLGVNQSWMIEEATTHTGDFAAKINPDFLNSGTSEDWLVTPAIDLSATSDNQLRFYSRDFFATNEGSIYTIRISTTSQTDISSFATLATYDETQLGNSYNLKTVDLTSYNNQTVYIAFVMEQTDGDIWYLDTISITGECATPSTQASNYNTTNINGGAGTATLNWTRGSGDSVLVVMKEGSAVNSDPVVGTAYSANASFGDGDQLGIGNYVVYNGPASSVNVSNLVPNTNYHIAVYEYANGGNCYNLVQLTGDFFVPCATYSLPFNEGFEDTVPPTCWTAYRGTNGLGTVKDWTSTIDANSGSQAAFVDWETVAGVSEDWLVTPAITIPDGSNAQLTFFTKDIEAFDYGSEYTIRVSTTSQTDRTSFAIVQTYNETTLGSTYNQKTINLEAYNSQTVYIAFVYEQNEGDGWFLDDVNIESVIAPPVDYIYNNGWTPADPSGVSTASDDIQIIAGSTNFTAPTLANNLTISTGASLTIDAIASFTASGTIVNDGSLALTSTSTTYSSLITNSISGSGSVSYNRHVNINASVGENDLISAPLSGEAFGPFATNNANIVFDPNNTTSKLFGPFSKTTGTYEIYDSVNNAATTLEAGVGYRAASTDNGGFIFTGIVNTGVVSSNIVHTPSQSFEEWNLIGNPYPSYLNVGDFLNYEVAPGITNLDLMLAESAAIYGYDGLASDGWITYNLLTDPNTLITPGQGFFVSADPTSVAAYDMQFAPFMRRSGSTDDFIAGRSISSAHLKLQASNATSTYNTDFYFNDNSTLGLDRGYDAAIFGNNLSGFGIYSHLVQDNIGVDMTIQSMPISLLNSEVTVALGLNVSQGQQVTISIADTNLPTNVNVYLEDTVSGTITLLNTGDYIFTANSNLNGTGRFFLRFSDQTLSSPETSASGLQIFATVSPKTLFIKGLLSSATTIDLYDMHGRLILSSNLDVTSNSNKVDVSSLPTGVYIVKLKNSTQQKTQKVIIK